MHQRGELLSLRLSGQEGDLAAVADSEGRSDLLAELQHDVLLAEEVDEPVAVPAYAAADAVLHFRELRAFGLAEIEDVDHAETDQDVLRLRHALVAGVCFFPIASVAEHRSENLDAFLALFHETAQFVPCADARNLRGIGLLQSTHTLPMFWAR